MVNGNLKGIRQAQGIIASTVGLVIGLKASAIVLDSLSDLSKAGRPRTTKRKRTVRKRRIK